MTKTPPLSYDEFNERLDLLTDEARDMYSSMFGLTKAELTKQADEWRLLRKKVNKLNIVTLSVRREISFKINGVSQMTVDMINKELAEEETYPLYQIMKLPPLRLKND